ncbi:N-acetylmuramoyl-L-alanine amidase [Paraflavitalea pollutisoli]|uniref:golvesin C-terminal-like domain-containing protein n=1 Tax=Paraflavitalea pollutisoli TaxID=3034143 RepID=UPI0023EDD899|nr:N-acetylmuramoyl-L-alanine amidase [Paraflavitalea sp. H1-2-19X]
MRKLFLWMLPAILCLHSSVLYAQHDSLLIGHINTLIGREAGGRLHADSIQRQDGLLQIFFNQHDRFVRGSISETEAESLTEWLSHLTTETNTQNILLLARDRLSGQWKTLDYFVDQPPVSTYVPLKNRDPFPAQAGKSPTAQARIFPGGGIPGVAGGLSGKTVWLSPGHGWHNTGSGFTTQRGTSLQLVEDFTTAETVDYYLLHYLMNAGANVWSVRERDVNPAEIIVDNNQGAPGYTETGTWQDGTIPGYNGTYRISTAAASETAAAQFAITVTTPGYYWVSVRFMADANRATDVKYTIYHAGGSATHTVNQEVHSDTWIYLGQYYFLAGGDNRIVISNQSSDVGQGVVADAVRLGGGVGSDPDCLNGGLASGKPRFEESARQYARYQGHPICREDVTVRPIYTEWELSKGAPGEINQAIYVAFHTNAGGGTGTETYRYNGLGSGQPVITPGSTQLRDSIHKQVIADLRAGWRSTWTDRGVKEANFGELRELHTIPGTLIELGFHDHATDAADLRAPEFRRLAARAVYKGILKFFHYRDGIPLNYMPEQPTALLAKNIGNNQVQLSWTAPVSGGIYGHPATSYRVYTSENGRGFDNPTEVLTTDFSFTGTAGQTYFFKVSAVNAGGESFASGVVAARIPMAGESVKYLIVDGFDRLDASAMLLKNEGAVLGNVRRMVLDKMNNYNYMVEHGSGLANCQLAFDGVQNEGLGGVILANYYAVDWFVGEESTADRTLDAPEKQLIKAYLDGGGRLLMSGAELGWDLGRAASANVDLDFFNNYLKAQYVSDGAGTYNFTGTSTLLNGVTGTFGNGVNGYYNVDFPDVVGAQGGAQVVLNYTGGTGGGAGVGYRGAFNVLYFGFPLEAITDPAVRDNLFCASANYLAGSALLPVRDFSLTGSADGTFNRLTWVTRAEEMTAHYQLERSTDGSHFEPIGNVVSAKGNSLSGYSYGQQDPSAYPLTWYRVKATDRDGHLAYSNIVAIRNTGVRRLYVLENPAHSVIRLRVGQAGNYQVMLANAQGQVLYQDSFKAAGASERAIPVDRLPPGAYWLSVRESGAQQQSFRVVVR